MTPGSMVGGKYELQRHIGAGGMGEVYLARLQGAHGFTRDVVVKRIRPDAARDEGLIEMFVNEARLAASVHHPNLVEVLDLSLDHGEYFIAMEYVVGASLAALLKRASARGETLPPLLVALIGADAARGLHAAHLAVDERGRKLGLVHRDVSPDNLLIDVHGVTKLTDFGIAKAVEHSRTHTALRGKLKYMAPEQFRGERLDGRADLFSLGIVLFEAATSTPWDSSWQHRTQDGHCLPPEWEELKASLPAELATVVEHLVQVRREHRPADADAAANALDAVIKNASRPQLEKALGALADQARAERAAAEPTNNTASAGTRAKRTTPSHRRRRVWAAIAGAGAVVVATALALSLGPRLTATTTEPSATPPPATSIVTPGAQSPVAPSDPTTPAAAPTPEPTAVATNQQPTKQAAGRPAPKPGYLQALVDPWAEVVINGKVRAVTPMDPLELPPGKYRVVLRNPDLKVTKAITVQVRPGQTERPRVSLRDD